MNFKKRVKNACVIFPLVLIMLGMPKISSAATKWDGTQEKWEDVKTSEPPYETDDKMLFDSPNLANTKDYEEQALSKFKIDGVTFPAYYIVRDAKGSIKDYPANTAWGLKINGRGYLYYSPNVSNSVLTAKDKENNIKSKTSGIKYADYPGDLCWNYGTKTSYRSYNNDSGKIGAFDRYKNFKPATQKDGYNKWYPLDLKYPTQFAPDEVLGESEGEGASIFRGNLVGASTKFAGKIKWRNTKVKSIVGSSVVDGEWRFLGSNALGLAIGNPEFAPDTRPKFTGEPTNLNKKWKDYPYTLGKYNTGDTWKSVRETTFKRFKAAYPESGLDMSISKMAKVFNIDWPATEHMTGIVTGWWGDGGNLYGNWSIPASSRIDLEITKVRIYYGDKTIYTMQQSTDKLGKVKKKADSPSGNVKLQPGLEYKVEITVKNNSNREVYNPTVNILGAKGANATDKEYELLDMGSKADGYWTYTYDSLQVSKNFNQTKGVKSTESRGGYFSVNGARLKTRGTQKDTPPIISSQTIKAKGTQTFTVPLKIYAPTTIEKMEEVYGVSSPNNIRTRFGLAINKKHNINDAIFRGKDGTALGMSGVTTSIDNLFTDNDGIAMSKAFYTQDLSIGTHKEFKLYDSDGKRVTNNQVIKGEKYTVKIPVKNPSTIFSTGSQCKGKIDYKLNDLGTSKELLSGHGYGTKLLEPKESLDSSFTFTVPKNCSNSLRLDIELSHVHADNFEDWYTGNNAVSIPLKAVGLVDLSLKGAMDESTSSSTTKLTIFKGETIGLRVQAASNADHITKNIGYKVQVRDGAVSDNNKIASMDANNPQTIIYPFKGETAKKYYIDVYLDHNNLVDETNENNNKHTFEVTVVDDVKKYASTSHVTNSTVPLGSIKGQSQDISSKYDSITPAVIIKRKDKIQTYDSATNKFVESWGSEYDYRLEIPEATLDLGAEEYIDFEEILFKSKYTTDRWAANKDRDIMDSWGYVNLVGGKNDSERSRIAKLAKVKAGYGFELIVKTVYKTNLKEKYDSVAGTNGTKGNTVIGGKKVTTWINNKLSTLKSKLPDSSFTVTDKITFFPKPTEVIINANNQPIAIKMPDGRVATTIDTSNKLIEQTWGGSTDPGTIYKSGAEFVGEFTKRSDGLGRNKRIYYLSNEVSNGDYYIRIGTGKIGVGGIVQSTNVYNSSQRTYAAKDIKIQVYGTREEDLVDN